MNQALKYRTQIADSILRSHLPLNGREDGTLYAELERTYDEIKQWQVSKPYIGLFVISVGLLTYGRLDVLVDIAENIDDRSNARGLIRVALEMVPIDNMADSEYVRNWVNRNADKLVWNNDLGKFEFIVGTQ